VGVGVDVCVSEEFARYIGYLHRAVVWLRPRGVYGKLSRSAGGEIELRTLSDRTKSTVRRTRISGKKKKR